MGIGNFRRIARFSLTLMVVGVFSAMGAESSFEQELAQYDYRDTRKLVRTVRDAADLIEEKGTNAFCKFRTDPDRWNNELFYVYVYARDGECLFHPAMPAFEGKNLLNVTDAEGKKTLQMALNAATDPDSPHGWVHYFWHPAGGFNPIAKSSCHFSVTMPDGREVVIGGGMESPPEERMFAKFTVDSAVRLLATKGAAALDEIRKPDGKYRFRDVKVFVLDAEGNTLVDPALEAIGPRNLASYEDAAGHKPFGELVRKLQEADSCWEVILTKNRYERIMDKRGIYARKGLMEDTPVIVGAATALPKPIWSK
ncbi:MAG: cache domain-containing protein [Kiritimatiellae bacterium]|nr:cache domain-containing protein [Kiritimatiellia bacterium]MDD4735183.1 cache domain-containing protein [Kiritimatiellia bacterium]